MLALIPESADIVEATADHVKIYYGDHSMEIERAINAALQEIVDEVAKVKPLYKVSEILKVGGFNEGTKILAPDEFDYLAVLQHFSEPGLLTVEHDLEKPDIVRAKVNQAHNEEGKWDDFIRDGYLRCMQLDNQVLIIGRWEHFGIEVSKAVWKLNKHRRKVRLGILNDHTYLDRPEACSKFASEIDKACIYSVEVNHPNVLFEFVIENRKVSVDFSSAIRYSNVRDCFQPDFCLSPILADSVLNRGSILLVGQLENTFRITFTETEVDYLNRRMSPKHKKLYIYLKYVAHLITSKSNITSLFPSYTVKLICIQHDIQCQRKGDRLLPCLSDVLLHYDNACHLSSLPSVFNKNQDIMRHSFKFTVLNNIRNRLLPCLRKIPELVAHATSRHQHIHDLKKNSL